MGSKIREQVGIIDMRAVCTSPALAQLAEGILDTDRMRLARQAVREEGSGEGSG